MPFTVPRILKRKLNVAVHAIALRNDFPDSVIEVRSGRLCWTGYIQPTPTSLRYQIRIEYLAGRSRPTAGVISPKLALPEGEAGLPHVFSGAKDICLHYPGEWDPSMSIATTIVPWIAEWLLHYEIWQVTHIWTGGGHEPSAGTKRESGPVDRSLGPGLPRLSVG